MHIGGFKEFFIPFFFFFSLPSFLLFIFGACDNLHIVSIYVHTKESCWQMDGMYLSSLCALLRPKMVKSSDKWWLYVDLPALISNV